MIRYTLNVCILFFVLFQYISCESLNKHHHTTIPYETMSEGLGMIYEFAHGIVYGIKTKNLVMRVMNRELPVNFTKETMIVEKDFYHASRSDALQNILYSGAIGAGSLIVFQNPLPILSLTYSGLNTVVWYICNREYHRYHVEQRRVKHVFDTSSYDRSVQNIYKEMIFMCTIIACIITGCLLASQRKVLIALVAWSVMYVILCDQRVRLCTQNAEHASRKATLYNQFHTECNWYTMNIVRKVNVMGTRWIRHLITGDGLHELAYDHRDGRMYSLGQCSGMHQRLQYDPPIEYPLMSWCRTYLSVPIVILSCLRWWLLIPVFSGLLYIFYTG
jgi:hypothetical protein